MDMLQSQMIQSGQQEWFNDNMITINMPKYAFIQRFMRYEEPIVKEIVTEFIFAGYKFRTPDLDDYFKKIFITRFLTREIGQQTVESFTSRLVSCVMTHELEIEGLYNHFDDILSNGSINTTTSNGTNQGDNRNLSSDLPQNNINLNVEDTVLNYGNQNTINRHKDTSTNETITHSTNYRSETFNALNGLWETYFKEIDKKCFLHVW